MPGLRPGEVGASGGGDVVPLPSAAELGQDLLQGKFRAAIQFIVPVF